jgi:hypothetical protein
MKFFTLCVTLVLAGFAVSAQQDTVPNPGFEHWTIDSVGYATPDGWNTYNAINTGLHIYTCFQDSDVVHSGKYSVKLVTQNIGEPTAGILTTGAVTPTSIGRGIPIASRPLSLNGWFQYVPNGDDSASAAITLYKAGVVVGEGLYYITDTFKTWTNFTVPVTYYNNDMPDTVLLTFYSGASTDGSPVNSALWLDDLSYSYGTGVANTEILPVTIYPNPVTTNLNLQWQNAPEGSYKISVYDLQGQLVIARTVEVNNGADYYTISTGSWASGLYAITMQKDALLKVVRIIKQ